MGDTPLSRAGLAAWVVRLREHRLTAGGVNILTRAVSSYLSWLHEEGITADHLRVKQLPNPPRPLKTFSDAEVRRIVMFRPKGRAQTRIWTLAVLLLDTGLRITEALNLQRGDVDLDGRVVQVLGKGHRERLVPISHECRKHLYRLLSRTDTALVSATNSGGRVTYRNTYRDIKVLSRAIGR